MIEAGDLYRMLRDAYGPQGWWSDDPYTVMFQSVLVQNTSWGSVIRVCDSMGGGPDARQVSSMTPKDLESVISSCGFARSKAATILRLTEWFEGYRFDAEELSGIDTCDLRDELLSIRGIGEETADVILLYALHRPVFIVDTYTRRLMQRLGSGPMTDPELREFFETGFGWDVDALGEIHRLILEHGIAHCRKCPKCGDCPLRGPCLFDRPLRHPP